MKEFIESIRINLSSWGEMIEVFLNGLSLLCVIVGVVLSLVRSVEQRKKYPGSHPLHSYFRKIFGGWLIVALEFQLAADIIATMFVPTKEHLIELGAIAVIRTFLNYFLSKELKEEKEAEQQQSKPKEGKSDVLTVI